VINREEDGEACWSWNWLPEDEKNPGLDSIYSNLFMFELLGGLQTLSKDVRRKNS
jgi:hypothetical protein